MKVHGMEARISKRQLKDGTFIKEFLRKPNCSDRITMTRWSLKDFHIELIDEYINFQGTNQSLSRVLQCQELNELLDEKSRDTLANAPMCRNWHLWQPGTIDRLNDYYF